MPIEVPPHFPYRYGLGAGFMRELTPIRNTAGRLLLDAEHWVYAVAARAPLLTWSSRDGMLAYEDTGALVERLRATACLSESRHQVAVTVVAQNTQVRLRLRTLAGTILDTGTTTHNLSTPTEQTLLLDVSAGNAGSELVITVDVEQNAGGGLFRAEAVEVALTGAQLPLRTPLGFQRTGTRLLQSSRQMDSDMCQRIMSSCNAGWHGLLRNQRQVWDVQNAPRMCGLERVVHPVLWPMSPGTRGLRVRVTAKVGQGGGRLGLILRREVDIRRDPVEPMKAVLEVPDSGGQWVTHELVLEPSEIEPAPLAGLEGLCVIFVCLESTRGGEVEIQGSSGSKDHLQSWQGSEVYFNAPSVTGWYASGIPQGAIRIGAVQDVGDLSIQIENVLGSDPLWEDISALPPVRQVVRVQNTGSIPTAYVEPPFPRGGVSASTVLGEGDPDAWHVAYWIPLGYLELACIEVRETQVEAPPDMGARFNTGQLVAAANFRELYRRSLQVWRDRGRVLSIQPASEQYTGSPLPFGPAIGRDRTGPAAGWWGQFSGDPDGGPRNPVFPEHSIGVDFQGVYQEDGTTPESAEPASWIELASWGYEAPGTYDDDGGVVRRRTSLSCAVLVRQVDNTDAALGRGKVRLRLFGESGTGDRAQDWEGEYTQTSLDASLRALRHSDELTSLRGFHRASAWRNEGWTVLRVSGLDDAHDGSARRYAVQMQVAYRLNDGERIPRQRNRETSSQPWNAEPSRYVLVAAVASWVAGGRLPEDMGVTL